MTGTTWKSGLLQLGSPWQAEVPPVAGRRYTLPAPPDRPMRVTTTIRSYRREDDHAVQELYACGRLGGAGGMNDTALDMDDIHAAYFGDEGSHFWVAEDPRGRIVGTVGVQQVEPGVGEVRRLRVAPHLRRQGIGTRLLGKAIEFCTVSACVKVTLDTHIARDEAIRLFEKHRFIHRRSQDLEHRELLQFYLDLYGGDR